MKVIVSDTKQQLGGRAAEQGAELIRQAIAGRGGARIILATGASQFEMLASLVAAEGIDWASVTAFHLDEYVGMSPTHPASFRKYLKERVVDRLGGPIGAFHFIDGEADAKAECRRVGDLIAAGPIDVAFIGIGENGHLAFNDPPADFQTQEPYIIVDLDEPCRRQQVGEGWFETLADVPTRAISMSIAQIMKSAAIICSVPDARKASAVRATMTAPVGPEVPASILRDHPEAYLYLDAESATGLPEDPAP